MALCHWVEFCFDILLEFAGVWHRQKSWPAVIFHCWLFHPSTSQWQCITNSILYLIDSTCVACITVPCLPPCWCYRCQKCWSVLHMLTRIKTCPEHWLILDKHFTTNYSCKFNTYAQNCPFNCWVLKLAIVINSRVLTRKCFLIPSVPLEAAMHTAVLFCWPLWQIRGYPAFILESRNVSVHNKILSILLYV